MASPVLAGDHANGETIYNQQCSYCHDLTRKPADRKAFPEESFQELRQQTQPSITDIEVGQIADFTRQIAERHAKPGRRSVPSRAHVAGAPGFPFRSRSPAAAPRCAAPVATPRRS